MLVQRAAEVEYILHGLYAHLGGVERPYTDKPHETVKHFITKAKTRLAALPERIPAHDRSALLHDLEPVQVRLLEIGLVSSKDV